MNSLTEEQDFGFDVSDARPDEIDADASDNRPVVEDPEPLSAPIQAQESAMPAPAPEVAEEELPAGLGESIALLQHIVELSERTDKDEIIQAARLKRIRAHVFALQQTPEAPVMNADTFCGLRPIETINRLLKKARTDIATRLAAK